MTHRSPIPDGTALVEASVLNGAVQYLDGIQDPESINSFGSRRTLFLCFLHNLLLYDHLVVSEEMGQREYLLEFGPGTESTPNSLGRSARALLDRLPAPVRDVLHFRSFEDPPGLDRRCIDSFARVFTYRLQSSEPPQVDIPFDYFESGSASRAMGWHGQMGLIQGLLSDTGVPSDHLRIGVFLYRAFRYAGYAKVLSKHAALPVAYSASPGRIVGLRYLLDRRDVEFIDYCGKAYWDLIEGLSLPEAGYDFSEFRHTFNPVLDSSLSHELMALSPYEALERVLGIRNSARGEALREEWAGLVLDKRASVAHGPYGMTISGVIQGSAIQEFNQYNYIVGEAKEARTMQTRMKMQGVKLSGGAIQEANVPSAMDMKDLEAASATQSVMKAEERVNLKELASELSKILAGAKPMSPDEISDVEKLQEAKAHAEKGHANLVKKALGGVGKWGLKVATDLAAGVVVKSLEGN